MKSSTNRPQFSSIVSIRAESQGFSAPFPMPFPCFASLFGRGGSACGRADSLQLIPFPGGAALSPLSPHTPHRATLAITVSTCALLESNTGGGGLVLSWQGGPSSMGGRSLCPYPDCGSCPYGDAESCPHRRQGCRIDSGARMPIFQGAAA